MVKVGAVDKGELSAGGGYVKEPGLYHFVVTEVKEGLSSKDKPIEGSTLCMVCMAGSVPDCKEKKFDLVMWYPKPSDSEGQLAMTDRRFTNLGIAGGLVDPSKLGEELEYDEKELAGQQILVELEFNQTQDDDGKWVDDPEKGLRLAYANVYHVDDPTAAKYPRLKDAIDMIDQKYRKDEAFFAFRGGKVESGGEAKKPAPSFDDI